MSNDRGPVLEIRMQSRGWDCAYCGREDLHDDEVVSERVELDSGGWGQHTVCLRCARRYKIDGPTVDGAPRRGAGP